MFFESGIVGEIVTAGKSYRNFEIANSNCEQKLCLLPES